MLRASIELGGIRTLLLVPLRKDDAFLGYITACRQEVRPFTSERSLAGISFAVTDRSSSATVSRAAGANFGFRPLALGNVGVDEDETAIRHCIPANFNHLPVWPHPF